ncbi:MAG: hypothetical protein E3K37_02445 [Candidatus Kuenenia sp.]|nr:hypothetical protein [Candidatus Kuenenia hertensis]
MNQVITKKYDDKEAIQINDDVNTFFRKGISNNSIKSEELEYQELCLTSLTVCCTCD